MTVSLPFADLSRASRAELEDLREAFERVVTRGWYVLGPEVTAFERSFAGFAGAPHAAGCASGTDAITLALVALGVRPDDEVITVSMTCAPTATGIVRAGARPVFVDVDEESLTMDPGALEAAVTPRTRAVVPVHLYGRPAAMEPICRFALRHSLVVVEDCAQAHGARLAGRPVGTFGDAAAWSFYPTKNLGALGDGGAVTTARADVDERVRRLRQYGYRTRNDAEEIGLNSRLDELQAALLAVRLRALPRANSRRAELAALYDELLAGFVRTPRRAPDTEPCHHLYVVRVPDRDTLRTRLLARGVGTDVHYPTPVHLQPAFARFARSPRTTPCDAPSAEAGLPVTERAVREVLSLPLYPELTDGEARRVCEAVRAETARGCP